MPLEADIGMAYLNYYTHQAAGTSGPEPKGRLVSAWRRMIVPLVSFLSMANWQRKKLSLMYLKNEKPGRALEVGCGDGMRLARLRNLGWEVWGQDVDPKAVEYARTQFHVDARLGPLEAASFPEVFFDRILLNHVLEHVYDPTALLTTCRNLLKPGGQIVLVTPNSQGTGHKHFGAFWRGLEPPRHIFLYSPKTLADLARRAGLRVSRSWTTAAHAGEVAFASLTLRSKGRPFTVAGKLARVVHMISFQYYSSVRSILDSDSGEECVLQLTR
jgi:2-polyprenyl-3-methyl-5-hydroxy-6-metoxy-1,4-benzoquinol methylase